MADQQNGDSPQEVIGTLKNSGWTDDDLKAVPALSALLDEVNR